MLRRLAPTLLALAVGFVALVVGLFGLQRIFRAERDEARAELAARRRALEQYALVALEQTLASRLSAASAEIDRAVRDPLLSDRGLYFQAHGAQLLPRVGRADPSTGLGVNGDSVEAEPSRGPDPDDPWTQREELLRRVEAGLRRGDRRAVVDGVRAILAHRASYVVSSRREVPFTLHLVEQLLEHAEPDPSLIRALLRDGLPAPAGLEGVQRLLLRRRDRFTPEELAHHCERTAALSERARVRFDDFKDRCAEPGGEDLEVSPSLGGPSLLAGRWYLEPDTQAQLRGVAVDLEELLSGIQAEMRERALLGQEDTVRAGRLGELTAIPSVTLSVASPEWPRAEARILRRYQVKTALVLTCGLLALGLSAMGAALQHRKHRFLELKSDFVATVSHELRTPLASVRVMAETLEKRLAGEPAARDYPARIVQEVDQLGFLVENILSFNRLDKNRWAPRKESFRLGELVGALLDEAAAYGQAKVSLTTEGLDEVCLSADRELLRLLFVNLVRNACRYNERDPVEVSVTAGREGGRWRVRVRDNGVGIPPEERENVFKEFHRLRGAGRGGGGSGLGLAICRRVMRLHGGDLRVASSGPEGTTFELEFP